MYLLVKNNKKYLALLFTLNISLSLSFRFIALVLIVFIVVFALPYHLHVPFAGIRRCSRRLSYYSPHIPSLAKWSAWFNLLISVYRPHEP